MPRKKKRRTLSQLDALRQVRRALPPPGRAEGDATKYRRTSARQAWQKELERLVEEDQKE